MATVEDALRLSARLPVFPCRADKRPATPHGFKDSARDLAAVRELWRLHPGPLIGWPTGEASGIDVVDVDPRNGGQAWLDEAVDALPVTRWHRTRSGGVHILLRHAKGVRNSAGRIGPGVDVRGDGGYVIHWPAEGCHVEQPQDLAEWPRWLLKMAVPPPRVAPPRPASSAEAGTRAARMISNALDRVRQASPGQRHYQLRAAAATLGGLLAHLGWSDAQLSEHLIGLVMATGAQDERNARATVQWAIDKGRASPLLGS